MNEIPSHLVDGLKGHVAKKIGAIARPDEILFAAELPKTRSGKIMRRLLRDIADGHALGDTTTLADPAVVAKLKEQYIGHTLSGQKDLSWDSPVQPAWRSFLYHLHSPVTGLVARARDSMAICGGGRRVAIGCRQTGLRRPWDNRRRSTRLRFRPGPPDRRWWPVSCTPHRRRFSAWCCARSCPIASWASSAPRWRS